MKETPSVTVTEADRRSFQEKGYWISPKLIDDARIERLIEAHQRIWSGDHDGDGYPVRGHEWKPPADPLKLRKINNGFWINDEVRAMVTDPILGQIAAVLLDTDEVRLWHDQVIYKPGGADETTTAGNAGWHQDFGYWQCSSTTNMVTVWLALQDTDLSNGCLMSIAGSHKWGLIPDSDTFFEQDMEALKRRYAREGRDWLEEPCILKAGEASFHHALTFHGSGPNLTSAPRRSVVAHLMPKGTAYRPRVQYHGNIDFLGPNPRAGQFFDDDRYFPVLYSK